MIEAAWRDVIKASPSWYERVIGEPTNCQGCGEEVVVLIARDEKILGSCHEDGRFVCRKLRPMGMSRREYKRLKQREYRARLRAA